MELKDFPGGPVVGSLSANSGDTGSIPDLGRFCMPQDNEACAPQLLNQSSRVQELQLLKTTHIGTCALKQERLL